MPTPAQPSDVLPFPELETELASPFAVPGIDPFPELASEFLLPETPEETEAPSKPTAFGRGVRGGLLTTKALFNAAGGVGAQILGKDARAQEFFLRAQELIDEAAQFDQVSFEEAFDSPGKFAAFAAEALGEQLPIIASVLLTGGAGAAGQLVTRMVGRRVLSKAAGEAAKQALKQGLGRGFGTGAFAGTTALEGGGIALEQFEELGEVNPFISTAFGAMGGALELTAPVLLAGSLGFGPAARKTFMETLRRSGLLARVGKTAALGTGAEAVTEMAQEVNALTARRIVDENFDLLGEEAAYRILESGVTGGLVGGVFGGVAGGFSRRDRSPRVEDVNVDQEEPGPRPGPVALLPPPPQPNEVQGPPAPPRSIVNRPSVMTVTPGGTVIPGAVSAVETELATAAGGEGFAPGQEVSVQTTPAEATGEVGGETTTQALVPTEPAQGPFEDISLDEAINVLPQELQDDVREAADSAIASASVGEYSDALATLEGDLFLSYDEAGIDPPLPLREMSLRILEWAGFPRLTEEETAALEGELIPSEEADLEPGVVTDEGLERGRRAGLYFDPEEQGLLLTGGMEAAENQYLRQRQDTRDVDARAAFSYDMPGLPARSSSHLTNLDEVVGQAIAEVTGRPAPTDWDSLVDTVLQTRHAVIDGAVSAEQYQEFRDILVNSGLAVEPAEVETPYSRRLPREGRMTVQAIQENFENATDEKTIAALVMDEIAPRGLEDSQLEIDMTQFWAVWQQFVPKLELVITDQDGMDSFVRDFGFTNVQYGYATLQDRHAARTYANQLTARQELWIWRNPLIDYHHTGHAPGIYGNFGHARISFHSDGTPMIMEVQGDYDIRMGGRSGEIHAAQSELIVLRNMLLEAQAGFEAVQRELDRLPAVQGPDGVWRVEGETTENPDTVLAHAQALSYNLQARRERLFEELPRKIKEQEEILHQITRDFRFGELENGRGSKTQWLLQETMRALRQMGYTEVLVPNNTFVALHEGWAARVRYVFTEYIGKVNPELAHRYARGTASQVEVTQLADGFADAMIEDTEQSFGDFRNQVGRDLDERYSASNLRAQMNEQLAKIETAIKKQARRFLRTRRMGPMVEIGDLQADWQGVVNSYWNGAALIQAGEGKDVFSTFARAPYRSLMRRYKSLYEFTNNSFDAVEEHLANGLHSEHRAFRVQLPEAWEDPDSKVEVFRDQLSYATGNTPQQDHAAQLVNQDIDNSTGAHC